MDIFFVRIRKQYPDPELQKVVKRYVPFLKMLISLGTTVLANVFPVSQCRVGAF
jgi:hypothetical protein